MATVNVTTANTFEQWRTKTNEIGTAIGDISEVTNSDIGASTIVAAIKAHQGIVAGSITLTGGVQMTGNLDWADNAAIRMGTGDDLTIKHDGTNSSLTNITGQFRLGGNDLRLQTQNHSEDYILCVDGGAVTLHYNDNAKIATTNTGVDVTGVITADGLTMLDSHVITLGTGSDLLISHDGTNSKIDSNTGALKILSDDIQIKNAADDETLLAATNGSAVILYHNNASKFATSSTGATVTGGLVTGTLTASGVISAAAGVYAPASDTLELGVDSTATITINDSDKVGIGKAPHGTYIVDVDGALNATTLLYGGSDIYAGAAFLEGVADAVGAMVSSNTESGLSVTYDDSDNTLDFDVNDPTITLTGDVTGSGTMTNLGSVTITTAVAASGVSTNDLDALAVTEAKLANDAVSRAKLKDEVTLLIINAAGSTVKTMYGAGS
jgi:hypothetical protein